jgi:hypothetical protein
VKALVEIDRTTTSSALVPVRCAPGADVSEAVMDEDVGVGVPPAEVEVPEHLEVL